MIIIISILYMFDMNIYFNTNELMGVNLLSINIEKNTFDISVKPLMSFIIFTISGIYLNYKNRIINGLHTKKERLPFRGH